VIFTKVRSQKRERHKDHNLSINIPSGKTLSRELKNEVRHHQISQKRPADGRGKSKIRKIQKKRVAFTNPHTPVVPGDSSGRDVQTV
jgi:hypothetical protein